MKKQLTPLFISLIIHIILLVIFVILYASFVNKKKEVTYTKVCIKLNNYTQCQPIKKNMKKQNKKVVKKQKKKIKKTVVKVKKVVKKIKVVKAQIVEEKIEYKVLEEEKVLPKNTPTLNPPKKEKEVVIEKIDVTKDYIDDNRFIIAKLLKDNLYYPRSARKRGVVGKVLIRFKLSISSQVHSISIIESDSDILSRGAIKTIEDLSGEFPAPKEEITLIVPINYSLK